MRVINMHDAKSSLSRLVESVERGLEDEIVIARNGKPAARLVSIEPRLPMVGRRIGAGKDVLAGAAIPSTLDAFNVGDEQIEATFEKNVREESGP